MSDTMMCKTLRKINHQRIPNCMTESTASPTASDSCSLLKLNTEIENSTENNAESGCVHTKRLNIPNIRKKLLNPSKWSCKVCQTTAEVYGCMSCGNISCRNETSSTSHLDSHSKKCGHSLFISFESLEMICLKCNCVTTPTMWEFEDFIEELKGVKQPSTEHISFYESGTVDSLLLSSAAFQPSKKHFIMKDKMNTAINYRNNSLREKTFISWKSIIEKRDKKELTEVLPVPRRVSIARSSFKPWSTGLRNLGNTCFMNSILQCLCSLPEFRDYFLSNSFMSTHEKFVRKLTLDCLAHLSDRNSFKHDQTLLTEQLHELLRVVNSGRWSVVTPWSLLETLWTIEPSFRGYRQQDALEFLTLLINKIQTEMKENRMRNIISEVFCGQTRQNVKCCNCSNVSLTTSPFDLLFIQIDKESSSASLQKGSSTRRHFEKTSLSDCLKNHFSPTVEDIGYKCSKCAKAVKIEKSLVISVLPKVLILVLKRFSMNPNGSSFKMRNAVGIPITLNLSPFFSPNSEQSPSTPSKVTYNLVSVCEHHGNRLSGGHYTAYGCSENEWRQYNDSTVKAVSVSEVESNIPKDGYILFYSRDVTELKNEVRVRFVRPVRSTLLDGRSESPQVLMVSGPPSDNKLTSKSPVSLLDTTFHFPLTKNSSPMLKESNGENEKVQKTKRKQIADNGPNKRIRR